MEDQELEPTVVTLTEDTDCTEMNRQLERLDELRGQLEQDGVLTADVALEHQALTGSERLVNAYFSTLNRQAKRQIATEGLYEHAKALLKRAMDLLWGMIVKVFNWLQKLFTNGKPLTEEALSHEHEKFKSIVMPVQRAERVPSSRTAIIAAVREAGLNEEFVSKLTPEEMDIYNEGPFHQAVQRMIPALDGFDVTSIVESLMKWHDKWFTAAKAFDHDNANGDEEALQTRLETFKKDAQQDLQSATQMATKLMEIRLETYQHAVEARRKLKADPNFHLGTDLSGIMARGLRIFDQSGYKRMGSAMTDVFRSTEKTVNKMNQLRAKANMVLMPDNEAPGTRHDAEEFTDQIYMKEVNRIISTLHQCVTMIQLINNYFSYVVSSCRTMVQYVAKVANEAIKQGGDANSLHDIVREASVTYAVMGSDQALMEQKTHAAGMTDMK